MGVLGKPFQLSVVLLKPITGQVFPGKPVVSPGQRNAMIVVEFFTVTLGLVQSFRGFRVLLVFDLIVWEFLLANIGVISLMTSARFFYGFVYIRVYLKNLS